MSWDSWQEILDTVRHNKLRTILTALSVAWGIFMLVILLAAGTGLRNAALYDFRDDAINSIFIRPRKTSLPFLGRGPGRDVRLTNADFSLLKREVPEIDHISGRFHLRGEFAVSYEKRSARFDIRGVHPDHQFLEKTQMVLGRFVNDGDLADRKKIAVIGADVAKFLFDAANPIGKFINVRGAYYQVIGVYTRPGQQGEIATIFLPISTAQLVYSGGERLHALSFTVNTTELGASQRVEQTVKTLLREQHDISPEDERALAVTNNLETYRKISDIFDWLQLFVWLVGIGTLFAGLVGVSNIMLISVKERTKEIGVRKALGAAPSGIVAMIMKEALLITSLSGYLGLVCAVALVEVVNRTLPDNKYLREPEVNLQVALIATAIVILAGALAGFFPARNAAKINPIIALRDG